MLIICINLEFLYVNKPFHVNQEDIRAHLIFLPVLIHRF